MATGLAFRTAIIALVIAVACTLTTAAPAIFSDDFEGATLDKWSIGGRKEGNWLATVVERHGSQMAHLEKDGFTEVRLGTVLPYSSSLEFRFQMETSVHSSESSSSSRYAAVDAYFSFHDASMTYLGAVHFARSTSSYPFDYHAGNPQLAFVEIPDDNFRSYALEVHDLLSKISVDESAIEFVGMTFSAYASSKEGTLTAAMWLDNVEVVPEPTTISLLVCGFVAMVLRRRRRFNQE